MRMLLMISNRNMSLRELYTTVLDSHSAGWITSFMSAMPTELEAIVGGYNAVIYEIGAADKEERVNTVKRLRALGLPVITHLEGRIATAQSADLLATGAIVIANPVSGSRIELALDTLTQQLRLKKAEAPRMGMRRFFQRLFNGV